MKVFNNLKCICDNCNGTGISFCYNNDTYGSVCLDCIGSGYIIKDEVYKIDDNYYTLFDNVLIEEKLFTNKTLLPIEYVSFPSPYRDFDSKKLISYADFLNGKLPELPEEFTCPLDYLDLLGIDFKESLCSHHVNAFGFENYLEKCPIKDNTRMCWDTINHSVLERIKKK